MGPFAVPEKIVGLTLSLDFFDRGTINQLASSATGSARNENPASTLEAGLLWARLRCPKKSSGLRFSSIFSTAAQ